MLQLHLHALRFHDLISGFLKGQQVGFSGCSHHNYFSSKDCLANNCVNLSACALAFLFIIRWYWLVSLLMHYTNLHSDYFDQKRYI